jgi:hypothetical protein
MQTYPLSNFIRNRLFDRYQDGLESRFAAYKFKYQLTYCEPSNNSAMNLDFEYKKPAGRMTVWESGECDLEVMEMETNKSILWKHYQLSDEKAFHELLANFFLYFRDGKNLPTQ